MGELLELLAGGAGWGLGVGLAIGAIAGRGLRPLATGAVRAGLAAGDRLGEWTGQLREQLDDVVAAARDEQAAPASESGLVTPTGAPASRTT